MPTKKTNRRTNRKPQAKETVKAKATDGLSKVQKFYIESKHSSMTLSDVSSDLGLDKSVVSSYYDECKNKATNNFTVDKLMNINSKRGYAVMSQEASEKGDASKRQAKKTDTNHIHKIRADK